MVQVNKWYYDQMDQSRLILPIRENGSQVQVRVFWEDGERAPRFGGTTNLPIKLFLPSELNDRIGFVLA